MVNSTPLDASGHKVSSHSITASDLLKTDVCIKIPKSVTAATRSISTDSLSDSIHSFASCCEKPSLSLNDPKRSSGTSIVSQSSVDSFVRALKELVISEKSAAADPSSASASIVGIPRYFTKTENPNTPASLIKEERVLDESGILEHPAQPDILVPAKTFMVKYKDGSELKAYDNQHRDSRPEYNMTCHGYTATGKFWVLRQDIESWLNTQQLFEKRTDNSHQVGDIVIYKNKEGVIEHSAVVSSEGFVTMAAGIELYAGGKQTTTVPIREGWDKPEFKIEIWTATP